MLPRVHPGVLRRTRLLELLNDHGASVLTVLDAGVGYGKTTLVRSWCTERPEPVIWMTLDPADDDPVRLWIHLATAVDRLGQGLGGRALMRLGARGVQVETAVDELMNGLVTYARPVTIVLDDLHAVRSEASLSSIGYAIERLPAGARVVVSTRSDPAVGLGKLRASRALTEVRARELAFTVDEARELFVRESVGLSGESVDLLVERTEGWPAGLYLAALWLRDLEDPDEGVRAFAGSARHVADYLTSEVLTALPAEIRDFLVQTSVLGRFTPELCDAVLGRDDSAAVLAELARSNMFLVALDARGQWYRYHHLFRELLQLELGREAAHELRRRAAEWSRAQRLIEDAIEYASAAGDAETVVELLLETHLEFIWGGRIGQFLGWVRWLPPELLIEHPLLPAAGAAAAGLLARPEMEVQRLLAVTERARTQRPQAWSPYVEAVVELTRAEVIERGDVGAAVEHARRAVAATRAGAEVLSVGALATLSQGLFFAGDLDESRGIAVQAIERPDAPDDTSSFVSAALGYSRWSMPSKGETTPPKDRLVRQSASPASTSRRTLGSRRWRTLGWRWRASPRDASTRPSERRYAASACDARRTLPLVMPTPCSYSQKSGWRDHVWRLPPPTSSRHGERSRSSPIRAACRTWQPKSSTS